MVVLSDKADYGSFAEPSSSGTLISGGSGPLINNSALCHPHPPGVNIHGTNANSSSSRPGSVSSESSLSYNSSSVRSVESESLGGLNPSAINNSNINNLRGSQQIGPSPNPNVHFGLSLDLGLGVNRSDPSILTDAQQGIVDETGGLHGTRNRASTSRIRNSSGNNNTYSSSSQPTLRLSPTDTIVVINSSGGSKSLHANGTTTQAYSNSSSPMSTNSGDLLYQRQPLLQECENGWMEPDGDAEVESSIVSVRTILV
jgi:hypothetical protein